MYTSNVLWQSRGEDAGSTLKCQGYSRYSVILGLLRHFTHMWDIKQKATHKANNETNKLTGTDNSVVPSGKGWWDKGREGSKGGHMEGDRRGLDFGW